MGIKLVLGRAITTLKCNHTILWDHHGMRTVQKNSHPAPFKPFLVFTLSFGIAKSFHWLVMTWNSIVQKLSTITLSYMIDKLTIHNPSTIWFSLSQPDTDKNHPPDPSLSPALAVLHITVMWWLSIAAVGWGTRCLVRDSQVAFLCRYKKEVRHVARRVQQRLRGIPRARHVA